MRSTSSIVLGWTWNVVIRAYMVYLFLWSIPATAQSIPAPAFPKRSTGASRALHGRYMPAIWPERHMFGGPRPEWENASASCCQLGASALDPPTSQVYDRTSRQPADALGRSS